MKKYWIGVCYPNAWGEPYRSIFFESDSLEDTLEAFDGLPTEHCSEREENGSRVKQYNDGSSYILFT